MAGSNSYTAHLAFGEQYTNDDSPPPQQQQQGVKDPSVHQRTYQACIPCRRRKVRCDLGSVDNPHDPPCKRCSRESKECFFSSTRRKKKGGDANGSGVGPDDEIQYIETKSGGRKRLKASTQPEEEDDDEELEQPRTPGGSVGRLQPLRRPQAQRPKTYTEEDAKASEKTAAILQGAEVHSGHDALKVLYEAAQIRDRMNSRDTMSMERPSFTGTSPSALPPALSPINDRARVPNNVQGNSNTYQGEGMLHFTGSGFQAARGSVTGSVGTDRAAYADALKAWSRFRFVREGWFTPREAIDYIKYFYKYLGPLTPVALPDFRAPETHERMLTQEPMLVITILLIASRHMRLDGPGAMSRPYQIHGRLWEYLQGMINRVVWGQEQFGGGFCGAGSEPASDVNPLSRKGLRTLGTVESLVLLTEWHPRMMHFPPQEADSELMLPDHAPSTPGMPDDGEFDDAPKGIAGQRMETWLEPCWRSDRMCWMLLGMAMSLAFEIGVFDSSSWERHARQVPNLSPAELQTYDSRRASVRDLLLVYVTQTSGRLGLTTVLPSNYSKPEDSDLFKREVGQHGGLQETVLHFWLRIAAIIREGNQKIFANKNFTRDLIKNGDYKLAIEQMQTPLARWRADFDKTMHIPKHMRHILLIEYEYCRVYINALALQAVAERCTHNPDNTVQLFETPTELVHSAITTNGLRTDAAIPPQTLAQVLGGDRKYMLAVAEASRNLLKIVVEGLYPGEYLRHAPVRTYFRIISVAMMMLKSFSLGASESVVVDSLQLMDRTVHCLRECIVDDVHVASRFADLLHGLSESLKPRLVRIPGDGRQSRSHRRSQHSTPAPTSAPLNEANHRLQAQQAYQPAMPGAAMANQQQQWNYNNFNTSSDMYTNPLLGISNDAYDLTGNDFSVMPPPGYLPSPTNPNLNSTSSNGGGSYDPVYGTNTFGTSSDMGREDWLTLPLDSLLNSTGDVNQTMYGPQIGGHDMLEVLLNPNNGQNSFN